MKKAQEVVKLIHALMNDENNYTARLQAEALVKEYARASCRRQRRIIAEKLLDEGNIINMDEPDFE